MRIEASSECCTLGGIAWNMSPAGLAVECIRGLATSKLDVSQTRLRRLPEGNPPERWRPCLFIALPGVGHLDVLHEPLGDRGRID